MGAVRRPCSVIGQLRPAENDGETVALAALLRRGDDAAEVLGPDKADNVA
jgi:hypothetical protein